MKNIHSIFAFVFFTMVASFVSAQSIERSVISSFGFTYSGSTLQTDCTLGETITATGMNGTTIITQGFHQPPNPTTTCLGDFDFNGVVNTADLLLFMGVFGCTISCGLPDVTNEGVVNTADLLLFMGVFGNVCE